MKKTLSAYATSPDFQPLSPLAQTEVKGGLLLYCEEKRRNIGTYSYTTTQWKLASNGKLGLSVQM